MKLNFELKNLALEIKGKKIFENISFNFQENQMVAIVGPSGCGKTSLLNCMGLVQPISSGEIYIDGENYSSVKEAAKLRFWQEKASFIYQDYGVIDDETVEYNVSFNNQKRNDPKIDTVLNQVGLYDKKGYQASVLSGGEKQRLGIARALYKNAKVIFADEPTASLDSENRSKVMTLLRACAKNKALVVLATHDDQLAKFCNCILDMDIKHP